MNTIDYTLTIRSDGKLIPSINGKPCRPSQFDTGKLKEIHRYLRQIDKDRFEGREDFTDLGMVLYEALIKPVQGSFAENAWEKLDKPDICWFLKHWTARQIWPV